MPPCRGRGSNNMHSRVWPGSELGESTHPWILGVEHNFTFPRRLLVVALLVLSSLHKSWDPPHRRLWQA